MSENKLTHKDFETKNIQLVRKLNTALAGVKVGSLDDSGYITDVVYTAEEGLVAVIMWDEDLTTVDETVLQRDNITEFILTEKNDYGVTTVKLNELFDDSQYMLEFNS